MNNWCSVLFKFSFNDYRNNWKTNIENESKSLRKSQLMNCDFVGWRGDNHPQTGSWLKSKVCLGAEEKDGHHTIPGAEAWLLGGNKVHSAVWDVSSTHVKGLYCMLLSFYKAVFSGIRESRSCSFFRPLETHALDRYLCCDRNIKLDGDHW